MARETAVARRCGGRRLPAQIQSSNRTATTCHSRSICTESKEAVLCHAVYTPSLTVDDITVLNGRGRAAPFQHDTSRQAVERTHHAQTGLHGPTQWTPGHGPVWDTGVTIRLLKG